MGASVRGSLALAKTVRAWALLNGRDHVLPADVTRLFVPVLGHRLVLNSAFLVETRQLTRRAALEQLREPASSSCRRRARTGPSRPETDASPRGTPGRATFPLVPRYRLTGLPFGMARSTRRGRGKRHRRLPRLRSRRSDLDDRLARERAPLDRTRRRRVHRPRAVRRRGAVRVRRRRPPSVDGALPGLVAVALETGGRARLDRADRRERGRGPERGRLPRSGARPDGRDGALLDPAAEPLAARVDRGAEGLAGFTAPPGSLAEGIDYLGRFTASLGAGSFVFVISDFLEPPPREVWLRALARRFELVPVVIQDPTWEQSFPAVGPVIVPVVDPSDGKLSRCGSGVRRPGRTRAARAGSRRPCSPSSPRSASIRCCPVGTNPTPFRCVLHMGRTSPCSPTVAMTDSAMRCRLARWAGLPRGDGRRALRLGASPALAAGQAPASAAHGRHLVSASGRGLRRPGDGAGRGRLRPEAGRVRASASGRTSSRMLPARFPRCEGERRRPLRLLAAVRDERLPADEGPACRQLQPVTVTATVGGRTVTAVRRLAAAAGPLEASPSDLSRDDEVPRARHPAAGCLSTLAGRPRGLLIAVAVLCVLAALALAALAIARSFRGRADRSLSARARDPLPAGFDREIGQGPAPGAGAPRRSRRRRR